MIAASTVIGMLTIGILVSMNLSYEKISAIIVMGACVGSIMPPMTQALALASSLVGTEPDPVINIGYVTVSIIFVVVAIYCAFFLIHKDNVRVQTIQSCSSSPTRPQAKFCATTGNRSFR